MNAQTPAVIEQADRSAMMAGTAPRAIVPETFDQAWRFAKLISGSGMAPSSFKTPEAIMVAVLHGLEVGLTPLAALQSIAVVNGRPTLWGDGALAVVRGSGLCEWVEETMQGEGDLTTATCRAKRKGDPKAAVGTFSVADARKAGLWGKAGPWTQYPNRMLAMRARGFAIRDGFADVLRGVSIREEVEDYMVGTGKPRDVTPPRSAPKPPSAPQTALTPPKPPAQQAEPAQDATDWPLELESYRNRLGECETEDSLAEAIASYGGIFDDAPDDVRSEASAAESGRRSDIVDRTDDAPADQRETIIIELRSAIMSGDRRVSALLNDLPADQRALVTDADVKELKEAQRAIEAQRNGGGR